MTESSFLRYLDLHASILELLRVHQDDLVEGRFPEAGDSFQTFSGEVRAHIREEEDEMLPIYEERAGKIHGGDADLFRNEHRKIEGYLGEIGDALHSLDPGDPRGRIEVIEAEYRLKELLVHHDMREKNILYPKLDEVATAGERDRIVGLLKGRV